MSIISNFVNRLCRLKETPPSLVVTIRYEFIDGLHVFTCQEFPQFSTADTEFNMAYGRVCFSIEQYFASKYGALCFVMGPEDHSPGNTVFH